jgi:hypothetical protein
MLKVANYTLPAYWASYLINGDASGLVTSERAQADKFLVDNKLPAPVSCGESYLSDRNAANGLAGDVCDYAFLVEAPVECEACGDKGVLLNQHAEIERCDACEKYGGDWEAWMSTCPTTVTEATATPGAR